MQTFEFDVEIAADTRSVIDAFWTLEDWPAVAPHVRGIDLLYNDDNAQVLLMHVQTKGQLHSFKSVRVKQPDAIYYFQPDPPPILRRHHGAWKFTSGATVTTVTSLHTIEVDKRNAVAFLLDTGHKEVDPEDAPQLIQELIRNNSLQTMLALKKRIEQTGGAYAPQQNIARALA